MDSEIKPLINILIRTSNRPSSFKRCLDSITSQDYPNIRIIIGYDNENALRYIPKGLETVFVSANRDLPFFYDEYLNQMMQLVDDGYLWAVDDDEVVNPNVISQFPLQGNGFILQLQRQNNIVPKDLNFKPGTVGMPCMILHHSLKNISHISGSGQGDFYWISKVLKQVQLPFVPIIGVYSANRGFGRCNG